MQPEIAYLRHSRNSDHEHLFRQLSKLAKSVQFNGRTARLKMYFKALVWTSLLGLSFTILFAAPHGGWLITGYLLSAVSMLALGFNFAHDAAHGSLFKSEKANRIIFELLFLIQGANGYLWRMRHLHSHHHYPNVAHCDADLEVGGLIHLDATKPPKAYHRFQAYYAPFLYLLYTLVWFIFKDFKLFAQKDHGNLKFARYPLIEWIKLIIFKVAYLALFIALPLYVTELSWVTILLCFLGMHALQSVLLLYTFLITHHVEETWYPSVQEEQVEGSWLEHQVRSANDFFPFSRVANFVFGGFNCHVAHHLFPNLAHIHYPQVSEVLHRELAASGLPCNQTGYFQGIRSHLRLLHRFGNPGVSFRPEWFEDTRR